MKRELMVAVAGVAVAVAGLSGCSSDDSKSSSSTSAASGGGATDATVGDSGAKVTIDGQDQKVEGTTVCTTMNGTVNIAVGGAATGIGVVLTDATPPGVKSVALGNVGGVTLGYAEGDGQGSAEATKDGNTYTVKGTATGVDMANPTAPAKKPFEIKVTCS